LTGDHLSPFDKVVFDFGDGSNGTVHNKDWFWGNQILDTNTTAHNYTKPGTYKVVVTVTINSGNGSLVTKGSTKVTIDTSKFLTEIIPKISQVSSCTDCPINTACQQTLIDGYICKEKISYQCSPQYTCKGIYICPGTYSCDLDSCAGNITKKQGLYMCTSGYKCTGKLSCDSSGSALNMGCSDLSANSCSLP